MFIRKQRVKHKSGMRMCDVIFFWRGYTQFAWMQMICICRISSTVQVDFGQFPAWRHFVLVFNFAVLKRW